MNIKSLVLLPLTAILLTSCQNGGGFDPEKAYVDDRTGAITDYNNYYQNINYEDRGAALMTKVHDLMIDTHKIYVPYSTFKNTSTYQKTCYNQTTGKIVSFYTGKETDTYNSTMNREHVWAAANSSFLFTHDENYKGQPNYLDEKYKGAGADMYHIMPANAAVNQSRGNSEFTEIPSERTTTKLTDGGPYALLNDAQGKKVQPDDHFKGDIARIAMYLYVHYNNFGKRDAYTIKEGSALKLTGIITPCEGETVEETIARWNEIDPPDEMEKYRNTMVQKEQGNRNPFIDHPEFVWKMFDLDIL